MSRTIDDSDLTKLSESDLRYLLDRSRITDAQYAEALELQEEEVREQTDLSKPTPLEQVANTGDANTLGRTIEQQEARVNRMAREQGTVRDAREETGDETSDEELEDLPYTDKSWTNDRLRGELARRGLSVDGSKRDLITRLEEDDALEDDEEDTE